MEKAHFIFFLFAFLAHSQCGPLCVWVGGGWVGREVGREVRKKLGLRVKWVGRMQPVQYSYLVIKDSKLMAEWRESGGGGGNITWTWISLQTCTSPN